MAEHKCCDCKWMHTFSDSGDRQIAICAFAQSENYLQEVGYCPEGCKLDGYAEELFEDNDG